MSDWHQNSLGELVEFRNGVNFSRVQEGPGLPILKVKDFAALHHVPLTGLDELDPDRIRIAPAQFLKPGDIVIIRSNGNRELIGRSLIFGGDAGRISFSGFCIRARVTTDLAIPEFVHYWLRSPETRATFAREGTGTGINNLSQGLLSGLKINLPSREEQKEVAFLLGALDDMIELNQRMNETLEAMARAIFKDWFVDFGPTRAKAEGRAPYLAPEIWNLFPQVFDDEDKPAGWSTEAVHDQAQWVNGAAYKNMHFTDAPDALPVIKIAELKAGVTKSTKFTNTALGEKFRISNGELLFSWSGNPDTSIDTFIWTGGDAWLNQHIFAVRQNGKRSTPFLYSMLKWLKPAFTEIACNKQTTGLGHVTREDLKRLTVCTGTPAILTAFDDVAKPIYSRIYSNLVENRSLTQTRDLLLPKLMSGEIRLHEAEKLMEAVA